MRHTWFVALLAVSSASAGAQKIQLELRPHAGDTLRMRLDQTTEISATRTRSAPILVNTSLTMYSRAIVESAEKGATLILAITDSISVRTNDEHARPLVEQTRLQLQGRQMRLRLLPDGTVGLADEPRTVPREVSDLVAVMPASFPKLPIAVGDTWMREMPIPPATRLGIPVGGVVRARFRLDSLSRGGDFAFVSMRGTLEPAAQAPETTTDDTAAGSVRGTMIVNRKRGWLAESRFLIQMRSTVFSSGAKPATPTRFRMKITQHMRVLGERPQ